MSERGLQLSPEKTCITPIEQGFDFLGQNLRKYGGQLLITPSKKNMHAFLEKVRREIRSNGTAKQENLIRQLNPIIRGRADYHRHTVADSAYRKERMALCTRSDGGQSGDIRTSLLGGCLKAKARHRLCVINQICSGEDRVIGACN